MSKDAVHESCPIAPNPEPPICLQHNDYTVAIICPMGYELTPVLALLDKKHLGLSTSRDQNAYELGQISQHNVVVAAMPTTGNNAAAMVVTQLLNDFGRIRFGLLVGTGGGVPDENYEDDDLHDIRLGDVVVSEAQEDLGGVVQFDRGKSAIGGFVRTGHLNKPPHVLASNVVLLKALHGLRGNNITRYLDEMLARYPAMTDDYSHPGAERDHLFQADYAHEGGKTCKRCDFSKTIERSPRKSPHPRIHYGTIGSSNIVIKSTEKRDELRDNIHVLCVDNEAAGLMEAFPCLVIRGIGNYADSHKIETWQWYAAAAAATYTKELLLQIPPAAVRQMTTVNETLDGRSKSLDIVDNTILKTARPSPGT